VYFAEKVLNKGHEYGTMFELRLNITECTPIHMKIMEILRQVGGGWALDIESVLGPVKWHRADRVPFGAQKLEIFRAQPSPNCPSNGCCSHQKHYAQGRINHRCIGGFMYKSPPGRGIRVHTSIISVHTSIPTCAHTMLARDRPSR
jgi:hypothetical protein